MFQGKVKAVIQLLAQHGRGGVLHVEDSIDLGDKGVKSVLDTIRYKHPNDNPATPGALMMGNADPLPVHPYVYDQITASCLRSAALHVKGAAGPSGLDVHGWRRLCTLLAKRLCTALVELKGMSPLLVSRLIALEKHHGKDLLELRRLIGKSLRKQFSLSLGVTSRMQLVQDNCVQGKLPALKWPHRG